jgi:sec-independent protein translocase protein TatA
MFGKTEELLIVLAIILLLFGSKKLPQLARSLGESVKEVRKGFSDAEGKSEKDNA